MLWSNIMTLGVAAFMMQVVVRPGMARYAHWKRNPQRIQVASRDWRGRYIPDLAIKRIERSLWMALAVVVMLGAVVQWAILMTPIRPIYAPSAPLHQQTLPPLQHPTG